MPIRGIEFLALLLLLCAFGAAAAELDDADLGRRIDRLRRADLQVRLLDHNGNPVDGEVSWQLQRHAFEFGTCVSARMLGWPRRKNPPTEEDLRQYARILTTYFSAAVSENALKWACMEDEDDPTDGNARAQFVVDWCIERGLPIRGHCLFWGVRRWLPDWQEELAQGPDEVLEARMKGRLKRALTLFRGKITEWDLCNEMMHQDIFAEGLGLESQAVYFEWARQVDPLVRYYVNEYGVLQGDEVDRYVRHIRQLLDDGATIGGIGDQAHFAKPIPSNQELWAILDKLGQFDLPVKITEFDLHYKGMTEEDQAKQLRRFYRVCFAHPAVEGIYMWGFGEKSHWRGEAAIWRRDWTPKPAARAYMKLIKQDWHTEGQGRLEGGVVRWRGFPGTYLIKVNGRELNVLLTPDAPGCTVRMAPQQAVE